MPNQEKNPLLYNIRAYLISTIEYWQQVKSGNPSFDDIRASIKIDTLEEYNNLVVKLAEDGNIDEALALQKIIDKTEKEIETNKK